MFIMFRHDVASLVCPKSLEEAHLSCLHHLFCVYFSCGLSRLH